MGKRWIVGLVLLGMGMMHNELAGTAFAQGSDSSVSDALPLDEPNAAPGPGTSDAANGAAPPAYRPPPPAEPGEFSPPPESAANAAPEPATGQRVHPNDENIDYRRLLRKAELQELPKGYRHHALGAEGYRPNTIAVGTGGRIPGVGAIFDYSWNRVGAGFSVSYRPNASFSRLKNSADVAAGQTFGNAWVHYNWIPFNVSPYILAGVEFATNTKSSINAIAGIGVEARFWQAFTIFVEYIRHETTEEGFPGAAVGYAF